MVEQTQWVINKRFDLAFFLCPVLLGLLYFLSLNLAPTHALLITAIVWVAFAQTHFGSTWFIFFDKKNREHYAKHPVVYFLGPLAIFAAVMVLGYYNQTLLIIIIAAASLYHVTKQNLGILQLYRIRNKEFEKKEKKTENATIFASNLFFGLFGAMQIPTFRGIVAPIVKLVDFGLWGLLALTAVGVLVIGYQFVRRPKNSVPKNTFMIIALLMYSPYIYASTVLVDIYQMEIATLTSLIAHYMQYIGLVWLINVNKYGAETEYAKQNSLLHVISKHYSVIIVAVFAYALAMAYMRWGVSAEHVLLVKLIPNVVVALMAIHFYIDAFIWRFRDPFVRETVLPFIRPATAEVTI